MKTKNIGKLDNWIEKASNLNNTYINSFLNGIKRDMIAVRNAIMLDYNNGLAEGSVNKIKVIKRIMYGRSSFNTLRKKILLLEKMRRIQKFN
jgi:transposase